MRLALALAALIGLGLVCVSSARADGLWPLHTIPREVDAYDFTTGRPYMAPPVPYGHYAKDTIADVDKALGCVSCKLHALSGGGGPGHGLFHHGQGDGDGGGDGTGCGHGSGNGCFGHQGGSPCGVAGCGGGIGCGLLGHHGQAGGSIGHGSGADGFACTQPQPSSQAVAQPSAQAICAETGCNIKARHWHTGKITNGIPCGQCGGAGCGACGGNDGHGLGHGQGTGCGFCGGQGCSHCLSGLGSRLHGKLASLTAGFHKPKVSWFLGAGGPVPLTPGYVPYIVSTRSPRDFFAFAPMNPNDR